MNLALAVKWFENRILSCFDTYTVEHVTLSNYILHQDDMHYVSFFGRYRGEISPRIENELHRCASDSIIVSTASIRIVKIRYSRTKLRLIIAFQLRTTSLPAIVISGTKKRMHTHELRRAFKEENYKTVIAIYEELIKTPDVKISTLALECYLEAKTRVADRSVTTSE